MRETTIVAEGTITTCHGAAKNMPSTYGKSTGKVDFLVFNVVPVHMLIGILEMKELNSRIDSQGQYVDFTIGRKSVWIGPEHIAPSAEWKVMSRRMKN